MGDEMNFNFDLFIDILWLGTLCGVISTLCLKKLKGALPFINSKRVSIIVNFLIGFFVSELFTNLSIKNSIAVGIVTWIGAETILDKINKDNLLDLPTSYEAVKNEDFTNDETPVSNYEETSLNISSNNPQNFQSKKNKKNK